MSYRLQILHGSSYVLSQRILKNKIGQGQKIGQDFQKGGSQGRQGGTQPFFELQTPYFAWKFVWTIPTYYEKINKNKIATRNKMATKYYVIMQ